jgi:hypothetical protein
LKYVPTTAKANDGKFNVSETVAAAIEKGIISTGEATQFRQFSALRRGCIMVDDFPLDIGRAQIAREPASVKALGSVASQKTAA